MAPDVSDASTSSAWLSVWLHPRRVVERILAGNFGWQVLLLAALGTISQFATWLILPFGTPSASPDWRIIAVIIVAAAAAGIVGLYLTGCVLKWTGALLGGRASMATIRAPLAWGGAPFAIGFPICLMAALILSEFAKARSFAIALNLILAALALWATVLALWMYGRVQGFGFWRTIASFA